MNNQRTGQRKVLRRVRKQESDKDFMSRQKLDGNRLWAQVFVAVVFVIAALTTFSFGLIGSWGDVILKELPPQLFWRTVWRGIGAALVVTALLDGARLGWSRARVAAQTTPWMQYLAMGMEGITFSASMAVSMLGLPPLLTYLGIELVYDQELLSLVLTYVLQISLGINLGAVFIYMLLSPDSLRLMKVADISSKREQVYLLKFSKILDNVIQGESDEIERYLEPIATDWISDGASAFLGANGYEKLPPPRKAVTMNEPGYRQSQTGRSMADQMGGVPVGNGVNPVHQSNGDGR